MDKEREWSLIVEDANTKLHLLLKACVVDEVSKQLVKTQVLNLITTTINALKAKKAPIDLLEKTEKAIKLRFVEWMNIITANLEKAAKKNPVANQTYKSITGNDLKKSNSIVVKLNDYDVGTIDKVSNFVTTQERAAGQAYMEDYVSVVKKTMQTIASKNLVMRDKNGRKLSVRNLAEMTARYQETQDRLQELKENKINYVVASSHVNASGRCQIWQGKVFVLDVDPNSQFVQNVDLKYRPTPIGKIDGIDYYSLADAMRHGFLGYNCRHRLVKYTKGMDMFKQYSPNQIDRERNLEAKQRHLERQIRKCKQNASMAITPEERRKWTEQSKMYQEQYHQFCHSKGLTELPWRTRISRDERGLNVDYDGDGQTYGGYINSNYEDVGRTRDIQLEDKIETSIGINNPVPKMAIEKLGIKPGVIVFRQPTKDRQGSAEHIILDHKKEIDEHYINCIKEAVENPSDVVEVKHGRVALISSFGKNKKGAEIHFVVVLEKQDDNKTYQIVTAYPTKKI